MLTGDYKTAWLRKNKYKKYYWSAALSIKQIREIGDFTEGSEIMINWMIRTRTVDTRQVRYCLNPRAFCWSTGKSLFLKTATIICTEISGPGSKVTEKFYFTPGEYSLWLLRNM